MIRRIIGLLTGVLLARAECLHRPIELKDTFIEEYKNRVLISTDGFFIDAAHKQPNRPEKDRDLHVAGRDDKAIQLRLVAEIMNARPPEGADAAFRKAMKDAVELVQNSVGKQAVTVSGAWRLWPEHLGKSPQKQGQKLDPMPDDTNPDHVFEIHPMVQLGDIAFAEYFVPIEGYDTKDPQKAFQAFNKQTVTIAVKGETTTVSACQIGNNYVEFVMRLAGKPVTKAGDGVRVLADVLDLKGKEIPNVIERVRMLAPAGTPAFEQIKASEEGDELHVLGVPRINMDKLSKARKLLAKNGKKSMSAALPYEMIVVAVYDK